jgi:A/G-specific adenine glycosylase
MPKPPTTELADRLLEWYTANRRSFPWRDDPQPYAVWVAEIMAQQTRLETMLPFYQRWIARFPNISALAAASQQEVLNEWEGLGYYSRARNLHQAARVVMDEYDGALPVTAAELEKLPGIGRYTAGAIASIAFGEDTPLVDGNVRRVFARVLALTEAVNTPAGDKRIWAAAGQHLPAGKAGDFNQALMDLGAVVCLPRQPRCDACPLAGLCLAHRAGEEDRYPVKVSRAKVPHHTVTAAVVRRDSRVLIAQRREDALLGGMWEYPGGKQEPDENLENCLKREIKEELGVTIEVGAPVGVYKHAYTHFRVTLHAFESRIISGDLHLNDHQAVKWVRLEELDDYPMGKIDRQISRTLQEKGKADGT